MHIHRNDLLARLCLLGMLSLMATGSIRAQQPGEFPTPLQASSDEKSEPLIQVQRIELSFFGGFMGGDTWLDLPDILNDQLTSDTAANLILDFSGQETRDLRAPRKYFKGGTLIGGSSTFYIGSNFGLQLVGSMAKLEAVLTGHAPNDPQRFEVDHSNVTVLRGGGNIVYNLGRESKWPIRPYVALGFGGVLNKFPKVDDTTALFFQYGVGLSAPLVGQFRAEIGTNFTLYSYTTDEVSLDSTVQFPAAYFGLTWRHDVPQDEEPASGPTDAQSTP